MVYTLIYSSDAADSVAALSAELRNPPSARAKRSTAQSIPNNTTTYLDFSGIDWNYGMTYASTGLIVPKTGLYDIEYEIPWDFNATGTRIASLMIWTPSSFNREIGKTELYAPGTAFKSLYASKQVIAAGERIRVAVWQNTGGNTNVLANAQLTVTFRRPV